LLNRSYIAGNDLLTHTLIMRTVILLSISNIFMTFAWYGHLKFQSVPVWKAILISWAIAFLEYCFMVPANRFGAMDGLNGFQLKITQEAITLVVFTLFALLYLKEPFHWKYLLSFSFILAAVYIMFR
jgi:uncharacterized protein (DUF486 family)